MTLRSPPSPTVGLTLILALVAGCSTDPSFESGATASSSSDAATSGATGPTAGGGGDDTSSPASTGSSGGDGGGGGSASSTTTSGPTVSSSVSAVSTGTGADCTTADDCADTNPCTIDTCTPEGVCESVGVTPGEAGNAGEGSCTVGVCQTDATCGLSVYSHVYGDAQSAWQRQAISEVLGNASGAPAFTGIREIVPLPALGYFLVFTDEGGQNVIHTRSMSDGSWFPPVEASTYLPGLPADIRCGYAYQPDDATADMVLLLSGPGADPDLQQAYIYSLTASGGVTPDPANPYDVDRTDEAGSPPPNADQCRWSFSVQTGFLGDPSWVISWDGTGANVYHFDGGSTFWTDYGSDTGSPIWQATGTGPASQTVVAAWLENNVVHLVAP